MKLVIAIPTRDRKGLDDVVNEVFARAPYLTIIEATEGGYWTREVIENEFESLSHGVGPIIVKILRDKGINAVAAPEVGCGVEQLLQELGIKYCRVESGTRVRDVVDKIINQIKDTNYYANEKTSDAA